MNPWKIVLATVVIFGTGVLTGALVGRLSLGPYNTESQQPWFGGRSMEQGSPGGMRLEFLRRIQRQLDLSPEQRESIDKIIKQSQERTHKIMEPIVPQLHQELQRAKAEFRQALAPAQQERFDELLKQQQRFKEQHHPNGVHLPTFTNAASTNSI